MLSRLEKRLPLLTGGAQDLPARQQTLRNTINWSYELLTPFEQRLFRLLSIFSGGCTLEALQTVCEEEEKRGGGLSISSSESLIGSPQSPSPIDILDLTTSLANKSLLRVVENNGAEPRLLMLETVREYAGERLREMGEHASARTAHANFVLALAEEAEPNLRGPEQVRWLDSLEREIGNVRVALEWCTGSAGTEGGGGEISMERLERGLRIAGSLARFWQARSHLHEAGVWLHTLLSRTTALRTEARERALRTAGRLTSNLRDREQSRIYYEEALSIARERGDRSAMTLALMGLGNVAADGGDDAGALRAYEECLRIWTELGQKAGMAGALNNIGLVFMYAGDAQQAVYHLEKSAQIYREIGDIERIAITSDSLGRAYLRAGDLSRAEVYVREGLTLNLEVGDSWNIAYGLISLAEIVCAGKDYIFAARLLAAADAAYDDLSDRLSDQDRVTRSQCLEAARDALGDEIFKSIWSESLSLTPEEVLANGEDTSAPIASGSVFSAPLRKRATRVARERDIADLSPREGEVLVLLAQRLSNAEIAEQLHLSLYTVNAHLRSIYSKLNLSSRADARRYAAAIGLI
jgi:DNA-binding CsgD family transcriptional regulator